MKPKFALTLGWLLWIFGSFGILLSGSYPTYEAIRELIGFNLGPWNPILDERLPRWIVLSLSGGSLTLAGACMQALFGNPLASPSSLGITSGGSLLIVLSYCLGLVPLLPISIPLLAFTGSLITLLGVYSLTQWRGGGSVTLLLVGLAISTLLNALESSLIYSVRDRWDLVRVLYEWANASSLDRSWSDVVLQLPFCLIGNFGIWSKRREIDIMSLGEEQAIALGVDTSRLRNQLFLYISLITGSTLASMGSLPFFGLLLPHLVRLITGPRNRELLPLCLIFGAGILCLLDWVLRVTSLNFLSLGNVCAVTGAAGFVVLFLYSERSRLS